MNVWLLRNTEFKIYEFHNNISVYYPLVVISLFNVWIVKLFISQKFVSESFKSLLTGDTII